MNDFREKKNARLLMAMHGLREEAGFCRSTRQRTESLLCALHFQRESEEVAE